MTGRGDQAHGLPASGRYPELEDALCERVRELHDGRPLAPVTIVVGSVAVRSRVGDLLVQSLGAVANVRVVTLAGLARDLVTEARGAPPAQLAGLARERFLRRLVAARGAGLAYFRPVSERPHFAQALAATFADLREACVEPGSGWAEEAFRVDATAERDAGRTEAAVGVVDTSASARAADLRALYAAYCAELERRSLLDGAQVWLEAAAAVRDGRVGGRGHTVVWGIYDLNAAQEVLVRALLSAGADLLVPVPRGGAGVAEAAAGAVVTATLAGSRLEPPPAARDLDRLAALWQSPTPSGTQSGASAVELTGDGSLGVVSVADERGEAREAVRAVLAAVGAGVASWDCAVVVPRADDAERLAGALEAAGLPVACRRRDRSAGPSVLLRLADCLAPPAGKPFSRRAVVDLLASAPLRRTQTAREAARWLDEARQAGVVYGLEQWRERMGRRRHELERRFAGLQARGLEAADGDDEIDETFETARTRLAAARGLEAAVETLALVCGGLPARASWAVWAESLAGVAEALFEPAAAGAARDTAGRLHALAVLDEEVDTVEMAAVLRDLVGGERVAVGRVGRHGVAVLTPLELRGLRFHTVVFTGLAEGGFPARGRPDPILGDTPRRRLAAAFATRLPLAEQRDVESTLLFAFACEAARERLTLLAPRTDAATGRPRLPSRLLLRLASLAAGAPVGLDEFLGGAPLRRVWRHVSGGPPFASAADTVWVDTRERDTATLLSLGGAGGGAGAARAYLAEVLGDPRAAERRLGVWGAAREAEPGAWDGMLGGDARDALAARHPFAAELHPTGLERYIDCPFVFLLRDVLGLKAPEEPGDSLEMEPSEFGTLAHAVLQGAYETLIAAWPADDGAPPGLSAARAAVAAAWERECAEAERRGVTGAALSWEVRRAVLLADLLEATARDPVFADGDGRPAAVEWRFGEAHVRPLLLELPGGRSVRFAGRLDRVDATAAGARVIDYKTGKGGKERERLKLGLSVQLPVYQLAARRAGLGLDDVGEVTSVYRLVTRRGGFEDLRLPNAEAAAEQRLRGLVAEIDSLVGAGLFPRSPAGRCDYCDVRYACGVSAWTRVRKRGHEALADLVRLQKSGPCEEDGGDA